MKIAARLFGIVWAGYGVFSIFRLTWELSRIPSPTGDQLSDAVLGVIGCVIFFMAPGTFLFNRNNKPTR